MLYINKDSVIPSVEKALGILRAHTNTIGVPVDYDRLLEYYSVYKLKAGKAMTGLSKYLGLSPGFTANDFSRYLKSQGVVEGLLPTKGGALSMSADSLKSAIDTGLYSKELCDIMEIYGNAASLNFRVSMFKDWITNHVPHPKFMTEDNHRIIFMKPTWSGLNTGRLQMSNPALFNVYKDLSDIQCTPKGWIFFESDSGQIEPRIIYSKYIADEQIKALVKLYNDAYYGILHYVTMDFSEILSGRLDFTPMEITDELAKKRKHLKTLGNAVNYGSQKADTRDPLKAAYIERIGNHPKRVEWTKGIEQRVLAGETVFHSAFGTPIDITKGPGGDKYDKSSQAYVDHLIRCAINNPIQGTAGDLMRYSVVEANKLLTQKAPNSFIIKYTHDSGSFAVHENDYDKVIDDLKGVTEYQVDGWIPIYGDAQIGRRVRTDVVQRLY